MRQPTPVGRVLIRHDDTPSLSRMGVDYEAPALVSKVLMMRHG